MTDLDLTVDPFATYQHNLENQSRSPIDEWSPVTYASSIFDDGPLSATNSTFSDAMFRSSFSSTSTRESVSPKDLKYPTPDKELFYSPIEQGHGFASEPIEWVLDPVSISSPSTHLSPPTTRSSQRKDRIVKCDGLSIALPSEPNDQEEILVSPLGSRPSPSSTKDKTKPSTSTTKRSSNENPLASPIKPKRKRGRNPRPQPAHEKLERQRERNRIAASTCRQKKKVWTDQLTDEARMLERKKRALEMSIESLALEVLGLKEEVVRHAGCDCEKVRQFVRDRVGRLVGGAQTETGHVPVYGEGGDVVT